MSMTNVDLALIQKQELFSNFNQKEIDFVVSHIETLTLPKKGLLFSSGEKASCFYILKKGKIWIFKKNNGSGEEEETAHFTSGDTIGDFDFARGAEYDACAEAAEDSHLIMFPGPGSTMDTLAENSPDMICSILLNSIIMMTHRIKKTNNLILENLSWVQNLHIRAYEDAGTGLWKQTLIADEITGALKDPSALIMLKLDRFKILVDSRGHHTGDETILRMAIILKNTARRNGHGWALRLKSNETGLIFNNCDAAQAEIIAKQLAAEIDGMEQVPAFNDFPEFNFSATISWCVWPMDCADWDSLFQGNYANLLNTWKTGGNTVVRYTKQEKPLHE